jgi:ribonuclease HII
VPLEQLRRLYRPEGERASDAVLAALSADPRAGARELAAAILRRRERAAREDQRLEALFHTERELSLRGRRRIAGVDEAGMGPLAGPVVAAAVVLPPGARLPGLRDSKQLSPRARERLDRAIREIAAGVSVGWSLPEEIDRVNIYQAGLLAMRRAVESLDPPPDCLLVDARTVPAVRLSQQAIVGGDARIASIAAASIVAKVYRDAWMCDLGRRYPGYGFDQHKGYGTSGHMQALSERGPTPWHRRSFEPVRSAVRLQAEA